MPESPIGAIHKGHTHYYEWRHELEADLSAPGGGPKNEQASVTSITIMKWGDITKEIRIEARIVYDIFFDLRFWILSINTPWGDFMDSYGDTSIAYVYAQWDNVTLNESNCTYTLTGGQLRFYAQDEFTAKRVVYTINSPTDANGPWAVEHDYLYGMTIGATIDNPQTCKPVFYCSSRTRDIEGTFTYGYRWKNSGDPGWTVDAASRTALPDSSLICSCKDHEVIVTITDSYNARIICNADVISTQGSITTEVCPCPYGPPGEEAIVNWWNSETDVYTFWGELYIIPETSGLLDYRTEVKAKCTTSSGTNTEQNDIVDGTSAVTKCQYSEHIWPHFNLTKICTELIQSAVCTWPLGEEAFEDWCFDPGSDTWCCWIVHKNYLWKPKNQCSDGTEPSNIHFHGVGESAYYFALTKSNNIFVYSSQFYLPVPQYLTTSQVTASGNCNRPNIAVSPSNIVYVIYEKASNCVQRLSVDQGRTWYSEETMFTGAKNPHVSISPTGDRLYSAFSYVSGSSGPGYIKVLHIDAGKTTGTEDNAQNTTGADIQIKDEGFDISYSPQGMWIAVWKIEGETDISHWFSTDEGYTWKRFT